MPTAPSGRRLAALCIDWFGSVAVARFLVGDWFDPAINTLSLLVFFVIRVTMTAATGSSPGQAVFGLQVCRLDGGRAGVFACMARTALLGLVIPAAIIRDGRGWHDRLAGTVVTTVAV